MTGNKVIETQDGSHSIFSEEYGVSYHSKYGAIQESRHVFIEAGLYPLLSTKKDISILEVGFGTGLNAFMTLLAAEERKVQITYVALEAFPLTFEYVAQLNYPVQLTAQTLSGEFAALHQSSWGVVHRYTKHFSLRKEQIRFEDFSEKDAFDLIFFDPFAPSSQPELWEEPVLRSMYEALTENGVLVTYCAKGSVKRTLKNLGFVIECLPGPPGKREMTRAIKNPMS